MNNMAKVERPGLASTGAKRDVEVRFDADAGQFQITILGEGRKRHAMAIIEGLDAQAIAEFIQAQAGVK